MGESERGIGALWHSFLYEVHRATASLMYLLQGMESVRRGELLPYSKLPSSQKQYAACFPKLSYVGVPLSLSGIPFDPNDMLRLEGEAEQLAFKGWVEQVYNGIWESSYRNEMRDSFEGTGIIRPQADPIGDLRLIRDDLIHNRGIASAEKTGRCTILKWFETGDRMILGMRHVFDFLNQMAFMTTTPGFLDDGSFAAWTVFPGMESTLRNRPTPRLVSLRTAMDKELEDGTTWYVVSVVFENGVFVNIPVHYAPDGRPLRERNAFFSQTRIDQDGNVRFPNGDVKDRESLYHGAVDALFRKGPKIEGIGIPGPPFRFRN